MSGGKKTALPQTGKALSNPAGGSDRVQALVAAVGSTDSGGNQSHSSEMEIDRAAPVEQGAGGQIFTFQERELGDLLERLTAILGGLASFCKSRTNLDRKVKEDVEAAGVILQKIARVRESSERSVERGASASSETWSRVVNRKNATKRTRGSTSSEGDIGTPKKQRGGAEQTGLSRTPRARGTPMAPSRRAKQPPQWHSQEEQHGNGRQQKRGERQQQQKLPQKAGK